MNPSDVDEWIETNGDDNADERKPNEQRAPKEEADTQPNPTPDKEEPPADPRWKPVYMNPLMNADDDDNRISFHVAGRLYNTSVTWPDLDESVLKAYRTEFNFKIDEMKETQENFIEDTDDKIGELERDMETYREEFNKLESAATGYDTTVKTLENKNDEMRTEVDALHAYHEEFETSLVKTHQKNITFFENAISNATYEMQETQKGTYILTEEVRKAAADLQDAQKKIDILTGCISDIDEKGKTTSGREYKRSVKGIIEYTKTRLSEV